MYISLAYTAGALLLEPPAIKTSYRIGDCVVC